MSQVDWQLIPDKRRYVLASLSLQWKFRRLMRPAWRGDLYPMRTQEDSRETRRAVPEGTKARYKGLSEDH